MTEISEEDLKRLRMLHCRCDDGSLCSNYNENGLTADCRESCEGFCKMWDELEKLLKGEKEAK